MTQRWDKLWGIEMCHQIFDWRDASYIFISFLLKFPYYDKIFISRVKIQSNWRLLTKNTSKKYFCCRQREMYEKFCKKKHIPFFQLNYQSFKSSFSTSLTNWREETAEKCFNIKWINWLSCNTFVFPFLSKCRYGLVLCIYLLDFFIN